MSTSPSGLVIVARMRALALLALLAACGNGSGARDAGDDDGVDAPVGDGGADVDAPMVRGAVTVRVVDPSGNGIPDLHVIFIDTDATVTHVMTDAAGSTQADVFPGAHVTAVRARDTNNAFALTTVRSLIPGDVVTLVSAPGSVSSVEDPFTQRTVGLPSRFITSATASGTTATYTTRDPHGLATGNTVIVAGVAAAGYNGTWTVSGTPSTTTFTATVGAGLPSSSGGTAAKADRFMVSYPSYQGASQYEIRSPCGTTTTGSTSATILLRPGCSSATMDLVVLAKNNSGVVVAYTQKTAITFTPDGSTTISDAWQAPSVVTATYSNLTARVSEIEVERFAPYARGLPEASTSECINEVPGTNASCADAAPLVLSMTVGKPAQAVMKSRFLCPTGSSTGCISNAIGVAQQEHTQVVDGTAATYALDVGANLLPWVSAVYVPETTTLDVTVTGAGTFDIFEANLRYTRGQTIYTWRVFGPVVEDVTFPSLPSTVPGDPTVRSTDVQSSYQVWLGESDAVAGYRDAIKSVYEALGTSEAAATPGVKRYGGAVNRVSRWN